MFDVNLRNIHIYDVLFIFPADVVYYFTDSVYKESQSRSEHFSQHGGRFFHTNQVQFQQKAEIQHERL